ncbi:hypothetical protein [Piscirickettsia litoralis]|uniref:Haemolysin-type calcium binding-related domain-containing protein n=1 Tax=Piscirickettsia litoralis TaxID=1891921 RepID=A0ABX3A7G5_9GAMM|nr:hypothetical protein [Piscirickettsia litoralis]ODN43375.1 hypothetical protein BGC07_11125 [Piscirickettsia litoralis]
MEQSNQSEGYSLRYDYYEEKVEQEQLKFNTLGIIHTEDGKKIHIDLSLNLSRELIEKNSLSIRAGDALKDPLIINFNGKGVELQQDKFSFDLDLDGRLDQISLLAPGNGFLALDKNNDGRISNGSELFGPTTGQGFSELSQYDQDHNQWIDENDDIFERLRIWTKDSQNNDQLIALGQANIGAIYLGHLETPFTLYSQDQQLQGQLRSTSLYLNEANQSAGLIQQIDLAI